MNKETVAICLVVFLLLGCMLMMTPTFERAKARSLEATAEANRVTEAAELDNRQDMVEKHFKGEDAYYYPHLAMIHEKNPAFTEEHFFSKRFCLYGQVTEILSEGSVVIEGGNVVGEYEPADIWCELKREQAANVWPGQWVLVEGTLVHGVFAHVFEDCELKTVHKNFSELTREP